MAFITGIAATGFIIVMVIAVLASFAHFSVPGKNCNVAPALCFGSVVVLIQLALFYPLWTLTIDELFPSFDAAYSGIAPFVVAAIMVFSVIAILGLLAGGIAIFMLNKRVKGDARTSRALRGR